MKKKLIAAAIIVAALGAVLTGCSSDATVVSQNLSTQADQFQIERQVIVVNTITGGYIEEIDGRCSITNGATQVSIICEVGKGKYIKDIATKSDNTMVLSHQVSPEPVSKYHYEVILKPAEIVPQFVIPTGGK